MKTAQIGIIGGSGLYQLEGIKNVEAVSVSTPFGKPSSKYILGQYGSKNVAFLPRHDVGHRLLPSELNYRANIYGFKKLGVEQIIAVSAVGSLKEEIAPLDIVIPHQFFDRTSKRHETFFGDGIVAHLSFAHPICMELSKVLYESARETGANIHWGGTYVNMEGPAFSTIAESNVYRQWGMDIIGMTNLCEAKLAKEAEICYASISLVTDFDCWHPRHESVTVEMVTQNLLKNIHNAKKILELSLPKIPAARTCKCQEALKHAIITDKNTIPEKTKKKLKLIIGKYI